MLEATAPEACVGPTETEFWVDRTRGTDETDMRGPEPFRL